MEQEKVYVSKFSAAHVFMSFVVAMIFTLPASVVASVIFTEFSILRVIALLWAISWVMLNTEDKTASYDSED